jgi:hypothetical protein
MSSNLDELKIISDLELQGVIDKKNGLCIEDGCNTLAGYNYVDSIYKYYCTKHKLDNMVNLWECKGCKFRIKKK